jgi:hypothetical protein
MRYAYIPIYFYGMIRTTEGGKCNDPNIDELLPKLFKRMEKFKETTEVILFQIEHIYEEASVFDNYFWLLNRLLMNFLMLQKSPFLSFTLFKASFELVIEYLLKESSIK